MDILGLLFMDIHREGVWLVEKSNVKWPFNRNNGLFGELISFSELILLIHFFGRF